MAYDVIKCPVFNILTLCRPLAYSGLMTGQQLKKWRENYNLSQGQLAEALHVDVMTVSRWEREIRATPQFLELALNGIKCKWVEGEIINYKESQKPCLIRTDYIKNRKLILHNAFVKDYKNKIVCFYDSSAHMDLPLHIAYVDRFEDKDGNGVVFVLNRDPYLRS